MYDELVKRLKEDKSWVEQGTTQTEHEIAEHIQQAADAIEELSAIREEQKAQIIAMAAENKPRWIPVTERLPEKEKKAYLCRTDGGYHCEVRWTDNVYGLWSGGGDKWGWSIFDIPQYSKVTHWMPLPQPPKESDV